MLDFGPALAGLGEAVEQQRQRKLQQALQALQIRKSMGQPISAADWQPIAQQLEQSFKRMGTPLQLSRQPQIGPAQTQVTPSATPAFGAGTAQIPPQPTGQTEYAPPRQPIGEMTVASFVKDPQRLAELAKQFPGIEQATLDEANQQYPEWRFTYRAGTGQGQMNGTFGDLEPWLKENPKLAQVASIPITYDLIDSKTGMPDRKKIRDQVTFEMQRQGLQPPTQHETNVEQQQKVTAFQAAVRAAESRIGQFEQDILHGKPGQIHAAVAARDQYLNAEQQRLKRAADALRAQGIPVEFTQLPYTRYTPEQLAGITRPEREQTARQEARDARSEALLRLSERRTRLAEDRAASKEPKFSDPETIDGHQLRYVTKPDGSVKPQEYINKHWMDIPDARFEAITGTATGDITRQRALTRRIAALKDAMTKPGANKTKLRQQLAAAEAELKQLVPGGQPGRPTGTPRGQADPTPAALQAFGIWGQTGRQKIPDDIWDGFDQNTKDYLQQHGYTPSQYGQSP